VHVDDSDVTFNICLGVSFQGLSHDLHSFHLAHIPLAGSHLRFYGAKNEEDGKVEVEEAEEKHGGEVEGKYIEYQQVPGRAVMHLGANRHEVFPIAEGGVRYNLILWCRK